MSCRMRMIFLLIVSMATAFNLDPALNFEIIIGKALDHAKLRTFATFKDIVSCRTACFTEPECESATAIQYNESTVSCELLNRKILWHNMIDNSQAVTFVRRAEEEFQHFVGSQYCEISKNEGLWVVLQEKCKLQGSMAVGETRKKMLELIQLLRETEVPDAWVSLTSNLVTHFNPTWHFKSYTKDFKDIDISSVVNLDTENLILVNACYSLNIKSYDKPTLVRRSCDSDTLPAICCDPW